MQHPSDTGQQTSPPRRRTSSIPRPTVQTNVDNYRSNAQAPLIKSPQSSIHLNNQKTRTADPNGAGRYPSQTNPTVRSFDGPTPRAVTTPVLKSAVSSPHVNRAKGSDKSFKDLVARFNNGQGNPNIPLGPQRPTQRSSSNIDPNSGDMAWRRREPQSAVERPSPLLSSLQSTLDRVNTASGSFGYEPKSASEPRHGHQQRHNSSSRDYHDPMQRPENPPLFGEIVPGVVSETCVLQGKWL
jgi:hypothetical protein